MKLVKIDREYNDLDIKDMSEIEIQSCILYLYKLIIEFEQDTYGEIYTILDNIENITYYCGKHLQIQGDYYLDNYYIISMFMIEQSKNTILSVGLDNEFKEICVLRVDLS